MSLTGEQEEARRLLALYDLEILDTEPEERFDRITRVAASALGMPAAQITLVDADRQWRKSASGDPDPALLEIPRAWSFCSVAITGDGPLVVPDATQDDRFADNPLVTGPPGVVFYAGQPVHARDGARVGTLCVFDTERREFTSEQIELLEELARWVELELTIARERDELARMQRRFVATASHELRTPLTTLKGHVEELLDPLAGDDEEDRRLATEAIDRSTGRLVDLVEDVLLGARAEVSGDPLGLEDVELAGFVRALVAGTPALADRVTVRAAAPVLARADPRRLRTAVRGLLRDALTDDAGTVAVTVAGDEHNATIALRAAVPPAGVGVALARAITLLHDGRVDLRLDATVPEVTLTLPLRGPAR
jgi:signal transduction histidine kinase